MDVYTYKTREKAEYECAKWQVEYNRMPKWQRDELPAHYCVKQRVDSEGNECWTIVFESLDNGTGHERRRKEQ